MGCGASVPETGVPAPANKSPSKLTAENVASVERAEEAARTPRGRMEDWTEQDTAAWLASLPLDDDVRAKLQGCKGTDLVRFDKEPNAASKFDITGERAEKLVDHVRAALYSASSPVPRPSRGISHGSLASKHSFKRVAAAADELDVMKRTTSEQRRAALHDQAVSKRRSIGRQLSKRASGIRAPVSDDLDSASTLTNMAAILHEQGNVQRALEMYERALGIRERLLPADHEDTAATLVDMAAVLQDLDARSRALGLYQRGVAMYEKRYGEAAAAAQAPPDGARRPALPVGLALATALAEMAALQCELAQHAAAVRTYERCAQVRGAELGPAHEHTLLALSDAAETYRELGDASTAKDLHLQVLAAQEAAEEDGDAGLVAAPTLFKLSQVLHDLKEYDAAIETVERVLALKVDVLGPDHVDLETTLRQLARYYADAGARDKALECYERALGIQEAAKDPEHVDCAVTKADMGELLLASAGGDEDVARALGLFEEAAQIKEDAFGLADAETAAALADHARALGRAGQHGAAVERWERCVEALEGKYGGSHGEVATALHSLSRALQAVGGQDDRALQVAKRALLIEGRAISKISSLRGLNAVHATASGALSIPTSVTEAGEGSAVAG
ncbi:unnamed protein product [Pedinophyceae sp. YPF-701]|nr:unnamed protein product [Pedinophyceae sp. YPF-701]